MDPNEPKPQHFLLEELGQLSSGRFNIHSFFHSINHSFISAVEAELGL